MREYQAISLSQSKGEKREKERERECEQANPGRKPINKLASRVHIYTLSRLLDLFLSLRYDAYDDDEATIMYAHSSSTTSHFVSIRALHPCHSTSTIEATDTYMYIDKSKEITRRGNFKEKKV